MNNLKDDELKEKEFDLTEEELESVVAGIGDAAAIEWFKKHQLAISHRFIAKYPRGLDSLKPIIVLANCVFQRPEKVYTISDLKAFCKDKDVDCDDLN